MPGQLLRRYSPSLLSTLRDFSQSMKNTSVRICGYGGR